MKDELTKKIREACFTCTLCGACCSGADNEVMVSPDEVEALMQETSLSFSEIAEPYPDWMEYPDGTKITFGWVLTETVSSSGTTAARSMLPARTSAGRIRLCWTGMNSSSRSVRLSGAETPLMRKRRLTLCSSGVMPRTKSSLQRKSNIKSIVLSQVQR